MISPSTSAGHWLMSSKTGHLTRARISTSAAVAVTLVCLRASGPAAQQPPHPDRATLQSLPKVAKLPSGYRPVGELAGRGQFYSAGPLAFRVDDGGAHHGSANTAAWAPLSAKGIKGRGTQGILYRVEEGTITAAGYLIRQADLVAGKSFRGLSLRELPFPAAHYLTIDLVKGVTADADKILWLLSYLL